MGTYRSKIRAVGITGAPLPRFPRAPCQLHPSRCWQLISALAGRKELEATDKLIDIAKNSTDLEMRRLAINYLSRKNDPRATKLLMELIEK